MLTIYLDLCNRYLSLISSLWAIQFTPRRSEASTLCILLCVVIVFPLLSFVTPSLVPRPKSNANYKIIIIYVENNEC